MGMRALAAIVSGLLPLWSLWSNEGPMIVGIGCVDGSVGPLLGRSIIVLWITIWSEWVV